MLYTFVGVGAGPHYLAAVVHENRTHVRIGGSEANPSSCEFQCLAERFFVSVMVSHAWGGEPQSSEMQSSQDVKDNQANNESTNSLGSNGRKSSAFSPTPT